MKLVREPLLHFVVIGAAIFALDALLDGPVALDGAASPSTRRIVVDRGVIDRLVATFAATWARPPSDTELAGLIDDHITEEVLYREALALGLEREDPIVRRRLRQKMEFIAEDLAPRTEPTDEELALFLAENADLFRREPVLSFRQVYFEAARRGRDAARAEVDRVIGIISEPDADPDRHGDPTLLPPRLAAVSLREVSGTFGPEFGEGLLAIEPGVWTRVSSTFGEHAVRLESRTAAELPPLAGIREEVAEEWRGAELRRLRAGMIRRLRENYEVEVASPVAAPGAAVGGAGREP